EMNLSIWGPSARSFYCIQHLTACQRLPRQAQPHQARPNPVGPEPIAMFGLPKSLKGQLGRVLSDEPTLAPMAHMVFCLKYPRECEVRKIAFRGAGLELTEARLADMAAVNHKVNRGIRPERNTLGLAG